MLIVFNMMGFLIEGFKMFKDFDITQICDNTKVVVFKLNYSDLTADNHDQVFSHFKKIHDDLGLVGVKALFIDKSIDVTPLTPELLQTGELKTI